jgi:hypothetical protein
MIMNSTGAEVLNAVYGVDYIPVRGDTINYWDNNWRVGVVINSQDNEITFVTIDNEVKTEKAEYVRASNDTRMRLLASLDEDDAAANRESFLESYIERVKRREAEFSASKVTNSDSGEPAGRGRKLSDEEETLIASLVGQITDFIIGMDTPARKQDIVKQFDLDDRIFGLAMKRVLSYHKIVKVGEKRSITYRVAGRSYNAVSSDTPDSQKVVEYIKNSSEPVGKPALVAEFGLSASEWNSVRAALEKDKNILITGKKRGTRYSYK